MLDIINGKVVTNNGEGTFEISAIDAHRALTIHLLELMEDNTPEHKRENFKEAQRLYDIGKKIYKDKTLTYEIVSQDLLPLVDCLIRDTAEPHLAFIIMTYITREYTYRIKELHEEDSLFEFFYILRDPVYTTVLKDKPDFELFYRIQYGFYAATQEYYEETHSLEEIRDKEYIQRDTDAFIKAVNNGTELPNTEENRVYGKMVQGIIHLPYVVAKWGLKFKDNEITYKEDYKVLKEYIQLHKTVYVPTAGSDRTSVDGQYNLHYKKDKAVRDAYTTAKYNGSYNICYYIALMIGSDAMRKNIARLSGVKTKIYDDHNSLRRMAITVAKTALLIIALFIGYKVLKAIYDFIYMPIVFWVLVVGALSGIFSTPESRASAAYMSTLSPYKRTMIESSMRQEKQLKELNENLQKYNAALSQNKNGYRHF